MANLERHQLEFIKSREAMVDQWKNALDNMPKFNLGDYLIAFTPPRNYWGRQVPKKQITNTIGVPKKYQVVHVDKHGISYIQELNKAGKTSGHMMCTVTIRGPGQVDLENDIIFEVDPGYTDALIFNEGEGFNAAEEMNVKSALWKEIFEHNRAARVNVNDNSVLVPFLQGLKPGTVLHKTVSTYFTIISINPLPLDRKGTLMSGIEFGEAQDSRGNKFKLMAKHFRHRAIYTTQPRSFKEVRDPK